jgi:hypothetical protein
MIRGEGMNWLGSLEVVIGIGAIALAVFLVGLFRLSPQSAAATPSAMRLSVIPVVILLLAVVGIALVLTGVGLI